MLMKVLEFWGGAVSVFCPIHGLSSTALSAFLVCHVFSWLIAGSHLVMSDACMPMSPLMPWVCALTELSLSPGM